MGPGTAATLSTLTGLTASPISGAPMMVGHRENQCAISFERIDERVPKGPKCPFPNARPDLHGGFRKLCNAIFSPPNLVKKSSS